MLGALFSLSPSYSLSQGLSLSMNSVSDRLAGQPGPGIFSSLLLQCWDHRCAPLHPAFYVGAWHLNSISYTYTASTLSTEPSSKP